MSQTTPSVRRLDAVVRSIATICVENEDYFCELDSVVGDGDFGYSLARGFEKVLDSWEDYDRTDPGVFLQKVALTISSRMGGTSGPIWGTAFLRASTAVTGATDISRDDVTALLQAAVDGIKSRGGADVGEKTLLDALVPMTEALREHFSTGGDTSDAAHVAAKAARAGAEATTQMVARRGRASYSGDRSVGSPDPGAVAVATIAETIAADW